MSFVEDQHIVIGESTTSPCLQIEVMPAPNEDSAPEDMLEDLYKRVVSRVQHCRSRLLSSVFVDELEADKRLARPRDAGDQDKVALSAAFSIGSEGVQCGQELRNASTFRSPNSRERFVAEDPLCCAHERGQGSVGALHPASYVLNAFEPIEIAERFREAIRSNDTNSVLLGKNPGTIRVHEYRIDHEVMTLGVIVGKVSCVRLDLVQVAWAHSTTFELKHDKAV